MIRSSYFLRHKYAHFRAQVICDASLSLVPFVQSEKHEKRAG